MPTRGNNNEKRPLYTLLNHTQRLINKKIDEYIVKAKSEYLINKLKEINFKHI